MTSFLFFAFTYIVQVSKPVKIGIVLGVLIIIYIFYTREPPPVVILDTNLPDQVPNPAVMTSPPTTSPPPPPDPKLVVDVYYECLCPDSRYFVLHHLLPTVEKVGSLMDVRLWPYGKASTHKTDTGDDNVNTFGREFSCVSITTKVLKLIP